MRDTSAGKSPGDVVDKGVVFFLHNPMRKQNPAWHERQSKTSVQRPKVILCPKCRGISTTTDTADTTLTIAMPKFIPKVPD